MSYVIPIPEYKVISNPVALASPALASKVLTKKIEEHVQLGWRPISIGGGAAGGASSKSAGQESGPAAGSVYVAYALLERSRPRKMRFP